MPSRQDDATFAPTSTVTRAATPGVTPASPSQFTPGGIIAGRYRLVALLGRGGMGEVYRADDLTLDQPVALKFLRLAATNAEQDAERLARFHAELRLARQVSHKNVCRLYDLGEADGRRFLTMEYVDGEDLGALLRRIGRFPQERAIAIARQLCAGVAAAHERGVIHRDLKPANVMIDADGDVRITDFGIAAAAADKGAAEVMGTPQYMAPEQLAGGSASIRSDIYALGLILFELFTGKRVFEAKTVGELRALRDSTPVTTPSSLVRDLDPAVERVILRCLERDPERRPSSALAVAAALPGSNPLAEALAAGETPSPDLLAAAAETETLPLPLASGLAAAFVLGLLAFAALAPRTTISGMTPLEKEPAVLADRAEQIIGALGYAGTDVDHESGFVLAFDYLDWIERTNHSSSRWDELRYARPGGIVFWYRTSPVELRPLRTTSGGSGVTIGDPPETAPGMRTVLLDTRGRLEEFRAVPPQLDATGPVSTAVDWKPLFDAASLDIKAFKPASPLWVPAHFADAREAWEGVYPERPDLPIRIEAASYKGRPIWFEIGGPWTRRSAGPSGGATASRASLRGVLRALSLIVFFGALVTAAVVARINVREARADRRAAVRLAAWMVIAQIVSWAVDAHHVSDVVSEVNQFISMLGYALYLGSTVLVLYLAIEPYARRLWPDGLLGWTRLFAGHVRDPRVGREILIGSVFGIVMSLIESGRIVVLPMLGHPLARTTVGDQVDLLKGAGSLAGQLSSLSYASLEVSLFVTLIFIGLRFVLRRDWAAAAGVILLLVAVGDNGQAILGGIGVNTLFFVMLYATILVALVKFGLLVAVTTAAVDNILTNVPFPAHYSGWSAAPAEWSMVLVLGLMAFGFYAARSQEIAS